MHTSSLKAVIGLFAITGSLLSVSAHATGSPPPTSWEVSGEFKDNGSPAGPVWSYGWEPTSASLTSSFLPLVKNYVHSVSLRGWKQNNTNLIPVIFHNTSNSIFIGPNFPQPSLTYNPRATIMHAGANGEVAVIRFKAPVSGLFRVSGQFYGQDGNVGGNSTGTNTSVTIVRNTAFSPNAIVFSGAIALPAVAQASFTSKLVMLNVGDPLDFKVAAGTSYLFGSTGIHAVIERVGDYCEFAPGGPNPC